MFESLYINKDDSRIFRQEGPGFLFAINTLQIGPYEPPSRSNWTRGGPYEY